MFWAKALCCLSAGAGVLAASTVRAQTPSSDSAASEATTASEEGDSDTIVPPRAVQAPVEYPEGQSGLHRVVLELVVEVDGSVKSAEIILGDPTFGQYAKEAARKWRFEPALRNGIPAVARIRFEVVFEPPQELDEEPDEQDEPGASTVESAAENTAPSAPSKDEEVFVIGQRTEPSAGQRSLSRASVRQLPGVFGDAFRAVETLPGVTPIISGLPYFYVRGAPPGNVGYFLDGIRVPLLFHIAAGPSVVHPAFIDRVDLYAGPYPARYGRFTGGIVAGETAPPAHEHRGEVNVRLVDAGGMIETHALDRRLSIMAAGRYSYTALVVSLVAPDFNLSYWDYQARVAYEINQDETVTLFAFGALDQASENPPGGPKSTIFDLVFHRYDLRYDKRFKDGGKVRAAVLAGTEVSGFEGVALRDRLLGARIEAENPVSERAWLRTGIDVQTDRYKASLGDDAIEDEEGNSARYIFPTRVDVSTGARADIVWEVEPGVRVVPGLRFDFFVADGTPLWGIDPRIYAEFDVHRNVTLRHGLGVAHQLPSFVLPLPGVQPVGERGLQRSIQHSAGVVWRMPADVTAEATVFQNMQINMTDALSSIRFDEVEGGIDGRGTGSGRGLEILVRRDLSKRLGGYFAYTLSRSSRTFGAQTGPAAFDRTHVLGGALGYQMAKGWTAGVRASYYTGIPAELFGSRRSFTNPPRTRPFYRFDWRLEKRWLVGEKGAFWALVWEVLNTTLNREQIARDCRETPCTEQNIGPVTIPSIGVEASF